MRLLKSQMKFMAFHAIAGALQKLIKCLILLIISSIRRIHANELEPSVWKSPNESQATGRQICPTSKLENVLKRGKDARRFRLSHVSYGKQPLFSH